MGKSQALEWFHFLLPKADPKKTWERILHENNSPHSPQMQSPVRRVHANLKPANLLGSWSHKGFVPGELTRAHGGVLIADEFLEWPRDAKECLREPLEQKRFFLSRKQGTIHLACDIQFVGTGNLCPCGGLPAIFNRTQKNSSGNCRCRSAEIHHYFSKLSGPVADRIDMIIIHTESPQSKSATAPVLLQEKIQAARDFCITHFGNLPSELSVQWLEETLLGEKQSFEKILSPLTSLRSRHKALRVARSIQALEQNQKLKPEHILEAISLRSEALPH